MLKLIVFAQKSHAKRTIEYTATVLVHTAFAFHAHRIDQWTGARMTLQTFSSMAHPCLAKITNRTDHAQTGGEYARMFDHTVARLQHAFDFATLSADRKTLHTLTEVAKGTRLLFALAFVALQMETKIWKKQKKN